MPWYLVVQVIFLGALLSGCGTFRLTDLTKSSEAVVPDGILFLGSTDTRTKSPDTYFATEYGRINERRKYFSFGGGEGSKRPPMIVGLALSGGGIRSNAFHMGLLSGLYAEEYGKARLLDRIDYTSSVSGGSWANAALWAWPDDLGTMFQCLDKAAQDEKTIVKDNSSCRNAIKMLRKSQNLAVFSYPGNQRKEQWLKEIQHSHLPNGCDVLFNKSLSPECATNLISKPYFIINSTHSARKENPKARGFPFETTPDGVGTVVDKGSERPDALPSNGQKTGFVVKFRQPDFEWDRRIFFQARVPGGKSGLEDGSLLSLAAAHSSAFIRGKGVPGLFWTYYFQVSSNNEKFGDQRLQEEYKLTDGGKSDNTGTVALVDRGVDILLVSSIGKEDNSSLFEDLSVARKQVQQLFGCEFSAIDMTINHHRAQEGYFLCPSAPKKTQNSALFLHPWAGNIRDFLEYLDIKATSGDAGASKILDYLRKEQSTVKNEADRFPQTPTIQSNYDENLIRAYYLLGKFIAKTDIAPFLRSKLLVD